MHFMHFADVIGCNNMLMLKVCKFLQTFASLQKFLQTFGAFILFYFILKVREALNLYVNVGDKF